MKNKKSEDKKVLTLNNIKKYGLLSIVLIVLFFIYEKYFVYVLLTAATAFFNFYHDRFNKTMFDLKLTLVIGIIVSHSYDMIYSIIFLFVTNIIPSILGGGRINATFFIFNLEYLLIFFISSLLGRFDVIIVGIGLVFLDAVLGVVINTSLGVNSAMALSSAGIALLIRITYFLTLGRLIETILTII